MRIGVIVTGRVRPELAREFGEYPAMFERLLASELPEATFSHHWVVDGEAPPAEEAADLWLITGSRHGVYEDLPWIGPLKAWLRAARAAGRPVIGVCFGHQILAEAFGGRAIKHPEGWRLGRRAYEVTARPSWAADLPQPLSLHAVHQDQVVALPDDATIWAKGEGTSCAGAIYGDPEAPDAISIQPHPEFDAAFSRALATWLGAQGAAPQPVVDAALAELGPPVDSLAVARAFAEFARRATAKRNAAPSRGGEAPNHGPEPS